MFHYHDFQNNSTFALVFEFIKMIIEKSIKTSPHLHLILSSFYNYGNICIQSKSKKRF